MSPGTDRYSLDELYECEIDEYYKYYDEFARLLTKALAYLYRDDAFFVPFYGDSWHFSQELIKKRDVVIIDTKDLEVEEDAIVTILHEAGHVYLGHGNAVGLTKEEMVRTEDTCWAQVRKWLPSEFEECIDRREREGGGSVGMRNAEQNNSSNNDG